MRQIAISVVHFEHMYPKYDAFNRVFDFINRGAVKDTRLESKAKDTKKSEAKAKHSLSEDRHSRGQGQECSRPRTQAQVLSKKKKKKRSSQKFFKRSPQKNVFKKNF